MEISKFVRLFHRFIHRLWINRLFINTGVFYHILDTVSTNKPKCKISPKIRSEFNLVDASCERKTIIVLIGKRSDDYAAIGFSVYHFRVAHIDGRMIDAFGVIKTEE